MQEMTASNVKIRIDHLIERASLLMEKIKPHSEESGQMSYLLYVMADIKLEGSPRSVESNEMLVDIQKFCDEIETNMSNFETSSLSCNQKE